LTGSNGSDGSDGSVGSDDNPGMTTHTLDPAGAGQVVSAACGDTVVVRLDEIPTSGYRWEVATCDPAVLELTGDAYTPSAEAGAGLGGGGQHEFQFTVAGPGETELRLICRRSWEPETEAVEAFSATIVVVDSTAAPTGSTDPG
jgi:inhibitor of cysteine peptidase